MVTRRHSPRTGQLVAITCSSTTVDLTTVVSAKLVDSFVGERIEVPGILGDLTVGVAGDPSSIVVNYVVDEDDGVLQRPGVHSLWVVATDDQGREILFGKNPIVRKIVVDEKEVDE